MLLLHVLSSLSRSLRAEHPLPSHGAPPRWVFPPLRLCIPNFGNGNGDQSSSLGLQSIWVNRSPVTKHLHLFCKEGWAKMEEVMAGCCGLTTSVTRADLQKFMKVTKTGSGISSSLQPLIKPFNYTFISAK